MLKSCGVAGALAHEALWGEPAGWACLNWLQKSLGIELGLVRLQQVVSC